MVLTPRKLASVLEKADCHYPALVVTGPRRAGKTTLFHRTFPKAKYILLEDPDIRARVRSDPRAFLEELRRSSSTKSRMSRSCSIMSAR